MGNGVAELDGLISPGTAKVHSQLCSELGKLIVKVSRIFSKVEAVRPGCSAGIEALCLLNNGIVKAKTLLQQCSDSSVLYLALTGDAVLSRCRRSKSLWEQSLSQIQSMVPVMLAAEISGIVADLKSATFWLDAQEEEAGRLLHDLLIRYGSSVDFLKEYALSAIHTISTLLQLSSKEALLVEKISIRKLLDEVDEGNKNKRNILLFFLNILKAYERTLANEPRDSDDAYSLKFRSRTCSTRETESQIKMRARSLQADGSVCSLSSSDRSDDDPVVIYSDKTCEGVRIEKWLDEEDSSCQDKKMNMESLILQYSEDTSAKSPRTPMSHASSLGSSMNDLILSSDFSYLSKKSDHGHELPIAISNAKEPSQKLCLEFISNFHRLSWDSQCNAIKDAKIVIMDNETTLSEIILTNLVLVVIRFLKDARMFLDSEARNIGCLLLLELVQQYRMEIPFMTEDGFDLLASFLDTNIAPQIVTILETLSALPEWCHSIAKSGALIGILNILNFKIPDLLLPCLNILINISSNVDVSPYITLSELIFKLIQLLEESDLSIQCVTVLRNLSRNPNGRDSIAETDGCIASIAFFLEHDDQELQEYAVSILFALCSERTEYTELVMKEGVIPGLVSISTTGNAKAMSMASELLRILKNEFDTTGERSSKGSFTEAKNEGSVLTSRARGILSKILCKPSLRGARKFFG